MITQQPAQRRTEAAGGSRPTTDREQRPRRALLTVSGAAGVLYVLAWIAGLSAGAPSPSLGASGRAVVAADTGHTGAVAAQYLLVEGLAGVLLAVVVAALLRQVRRRRAAETGPLPFIGAVAGLIAAVISVTQCVLGVTLAHEVGRGAAGPAHALFDAANRLDGVKMIALAALACGGAALARRGGPLRRRLGVLGVALAVALVGSAVAYGLLLQPIAWLAYVSGVLLLAWVACLGLSLPAARRR